MPALPLDITEVIIDFLADDDPSSLRVCALVCHDFHHLCRNHIFATIVLNNGHVPPPLPTRSMIRTTAPRLQEMLSAFPEIADCIRHLILNISIDDLEHGSLLQTFRQITRLKFLRVSKHNIDGRGFQWNDNPLRPALLQLLHLPTLTQLHLAEIDNFIISDLAPCINLQHFGFNHLTVFDAEETVTSKLPETSLRLRVLSVGAASAAPAEITKICAAYCADGQSFIDFGYLNKLSINLHRPADIQASLYVFSCCKKLTSVEISIDVSHDVKDLTEINLFKMLYPSMPTLRHLQVNTTFTEGDGSIDPFCGLCNELEEMKNRNIIETITLRVTVDRNSYFLRDDQWGRIDTVLTQSGWPKLQQVSLTINVWSYSEGDELDELDSALRKYPQTQFPKLTSIYNYNLWVLAFCVALMHWFFNPVG